MSEDLSGESIEVDPDPTVSPDLSRPMEMPKSVFTGPLSSLSEEQRTRVGALNLAAPLLAEKGLLGVGKPPDIGDLIRLADWILSGESEPLYPYTSGEVVILGPELFVNLDSTTICWKGQNFYSAPFGEDADDD